LILQKLWKCAGAGLFTKAGSLVFERDGLESKKLLSNKSPHFVESLGELYVPWVFPVLCLVEELLMVSLGVLNKGKAFFDDESAQTAAFNFARVVEVIRIGGIDSVLVISAGKELIGDDLEMRSPGYLTGVE
jgi:hypothetical protein